MGANERAANAARRRHSISAHVGPTPTLCRVLAALQIVGNDFYSSHEVPRLGYATTRHGNSSSTRQEQLVSAPLIEFRRVRKAFGPKVIYSGLDLSVPRGAALTIVGGSGVGKSVLLKMLIRLLTPDSGSIVFDGEEVTTMNERELSRLRQRIAMLFQAGALFDSLDVGKNVAYG